MELLLLMDGMRRGGAARITAVLPIYGYARQDKKDRSRAPISERLVAVFESKHARRPPSQSQLLQSPQLLTHIMTTFCVRAF